MSVNVVALARSGAASGYKTYLATPAGFAPQDSVFYGPTLAGHIAAFGATTFDVADPGTAETFTFTFQTTDAWPTTLPGTASGSIPQ